MSRHASYCVALVAAIAIAAAVASSAAENPYLGRWNLTGIGPDGGIYWLEIRDEGGQLTGMFLNRGGSPVKLATVKVENGELFFQVRGTCTRPGPRVSSAHSGKHTDRDHQDAVAHDRVHRRASAEVAAVRRQRASQVGEAGRPLRWQVNGRLGRAGPDQAVRLDGGRRRDDEHTERQ